MLNVEICYICGKKISADPKDFGERIAGSIKPRGLRTRYFCAACWNEEMMRSKTRLGKGKRGTGMTREEAIDQLKIEYIGEYEKDREAKNMAIKALEREPKWIPVSERLPEESGEYLITIKDRTYLEISWFYPSDIKWSYRNAEIIAWMPLPEPYKESEEQG